MRHDGERQWKDRRMEYKERDSQYGTHGVRGRVVLWAEIKSKHDIHLIWLMESYWLIWWPVESFFLRQIQFRTVKAGHAPNYVYQDLTMFISVGLRFNEFERCLCECKSFLLPTDAKENCFQRSIKIYIKITRAPTCFDVITFIRERN